MQLSKTKFNIYRSLGNAKMRRKHGLFTVEGEKGVRDSINNFEVVAVIKVKDENVEFIPTDIPIYEVNDREMMQLSNLTTPPTVIAVYKLPIQESADLKCNPKKLYVVLDGIQDPGNLGTIIRTCHWFGLDTIFASHDTVDIFNPKTLQSTMGSFAKTNVIYCDLSKLFVLNSDMPVYGLLLDGRDIYKADLGKAGFIVMGNEGKGISEKLRSKITERLLIPPGGENHSESLNVAVATGITLSQFIGCR